MRRTWRMLYAARFVAKWEGWLSCPYLDTLASPDIPTQGYGHTRYAGAPDVQMGGPCWAKAKGLRVLSRDLRSAAKTVDDKVHARLTFRQRIALISFVFNVGPGGLDDQDIIRPLNRGRFAEAARHLLNWDHAGGVVVQGLSNRRHAEAYMLTHSKAHKGKPTPVHHRAHKR